MMVFLMSLFKIFAFAFGVVLGILTFIAILIVITVYISNGFNYDGEGE
jgi:hypothetical protein